MHSQVEASLGFVNAYYIDVCFSILLKIFIWKPAMQPQYSLRVVSVFVIAVVSVDLHAVHRGGDLENRADVSEASQKESKKFGFLDNIRNTKLKHNQALELLSFLITEALKARPSETRMLLKNPLFTAATLGTYEVVVEIIKAYPESVWFVDTANRRNIFHLAIIHRQKFIFSILKGLSPQNKHLVTSSTDHGGDNVLHLAARLGPLDEIPGAALQMHSDMQWFKVTHHIIILAPSSLICSLEE